MGYLNVQDASTFVLGIPAGVQTQFVIERAFQKILAAAEPLYRKYLDKLDAIECQIVDNTENLAVEELGDIKLRGDEFQRLIDRYKWHQGALANLLGVPPNPYDARPWMGTGYNGGGGLNIPVTG